VPRAPIRIPLPAGSVEQIVTGAAFVLPAIAGGAYSFCSVVEPERSAPQVVINVFGMLSPEQAEVILQALPSHARGIVTGEPGPWPERLSYRQAEDLFKAASDGATLHQLRQQRVAS
jgi:hypothetical protein